ncbi:MAG: DUF1768 domain-containing protein [Clostridia bacterium]|nr:DUF1768 domain-containing protein [Clostridia bacterium]
MAKDTLPQGAIENFIKEKTLMPPPFLAFPSYGRYSMGWRMGSGEGYVIKFGAWLRRFCEEDQRIYQNLFPSPITLFDYWNGDFNQTEFPEEYEHKQLFSYRWSLTGSTEYGMKWLTETLKTEKPLRFYFFENEIPYGRKAVDPCSVWARAPFTPPCFPEEETMTCAADYLIYCKALFTGRKALIRKAWERAGNPDGIRATAEKLAPYTDDEWKRIFPDILALSQYFKFSENDGFRKFLLSREEDVFFCIDPDDRILGCRIDTDPATGAQSIVGENLLGFAIMNAREEIRKIYGNLHLCENFR